MSMRIHTAQAASVGVTICDRERLTELFDIDDVPQGLVIEDGGNCEALLLAGTTVQLVNLAHDILAACNELIESEGDDH